MKLKEFLSSQNKLELLVQFIKFGAVGASNTAISLGVYYLLVYFGVHYIIANAAGFVLSVINSFYWNNKYVFGKEKTEMSTVRAFIKVFMSYGVSFLISTVLMFVFVDVFGLSDKIAPLLRLIVTIPLNFLMNKLWAFRKRGQ